MKKYTSKLIKFFLTSLLLFTSVSSCDDKNQVVPYVYVQFEIFLGDPDMQDLIPIGGSVMVNGGHRGIIIYHNSIDEYTAYDRACTYHPNEDCRVQLGNSWASLECDCCDSEYLLYNDAIPSKGPAEIGLLKYNVTYYQSSQLLVIRN